MPKIYIYSSLSNDQRYMLPDGREILIAGRANVAKRNLESPRGVVTEIDESILEGLRGNAVFAAHERNHFIKCDTRKRDPEKVAKDNLEAKDKSAQATEESLKENKKAATVKK